MGRRYHLLRLEHSGMSNSKLKKQKAKEPFTMTNGMKNKGMANHTAMDVPKYQ